LAPALTESGYHYYGHEIRRRRTDKQEPLDRKRQVLRNTTENTIMDDHQNPRVETLPSVRKQSLPGKAPATALRHQERIDELANSALDCKDVRQAVVQFAMAQSFEMAAIVGQQVQRGLAVPLTVREFRKNILPMLSTAATLIKQGARCAQIDREYEQASDGDDRPSRSTEAERGESAL